LFKKNKALLLFISIICLLGAYGWNVRVKYSTAIPVFSAPSRSFNFIQYDLNDLEIYHPEEKFDFLFQKMSKLIFEGKGHISILHMGGSHVQGGALTDRMRSNFSTLTYGVTGERGFVFPYKMASTNSPSTIKCDWTGHWNGCRNSVSSDDCTWGMSGISTYTYDKSASFKIRTMKADSSFYRSNRIKVFYQCSDEYELLPDTNLLLREIVRNPEQGFDEFIFEEMYESVEFKVQRPDSIQDGYFVLQGLYLGNNSPGITYNTIGVNGAGTYSYLRCDMFKEQMQTLKPDLVFFGIGVNDANVPENDFNSALYEARYDSIISMIKQSNPAACFVFITNNDVYYQKKYPNRNGLKVQESMQRLAEKHNGAVYDLFAIMGGLGSIDDWRDSGLAAGDRIHLTKKGYELQADLMFEAFRNSFGNYLSQKNP
jgi:lysophospholipase L1-like esterase